MLLKTPTTKCSFPALTKQVPYTAEPAFCILKFALMMQLSISAHLYYVNTAYLFCYPYLPLLYSNVFCKHRCLQYRISEDQPDYTCWFKTICNAECINGKAKICVNILLLLIIFFLYITISKQKENTLDRNFFEVASKVFSNYVVITQYRYSSTNEMEGFDRIMVSSPSSRGRARLPRSLAFKLFKSLISFAKKGPPDGWSFFGK